MFITSSAMVCPVGLTALTACAAKRAGLSALADLPFPDNSGKPIVGSAVPDVDLAMGSDDRILRLLTGALSDLLEQCSGFKWERVPILIALAEPGRPGGQADLAGSVVARVQQTLGVRFQPQASRAFASGHTGGFEALRAARECLRSGAAAACVVCGVDSYLNPQSLLWLDRQYRLKTSANRDGVIPGEAASAALVQSEPVNGAAVHIRGLGFSTELAHILSEEPLMARGLADAARIALAEATLGFHEIDLRLSDVTGELYGFKELPLVEGRLMRVIRKVEQPLWHWSEAIGDSGAAAGVAQLVLADQAFRKGYAPGQSAICLTSSVPGGRAVAVLSARANAVAPW